MKKDVYKKFLDIIFEGSDDSYSKKYFQTLSDNLNIIDEDNLR